MTGAKRGGAGGKDAITWFSQTRGTVKVGTIEVEYIALSEVLQEVLIVWQMHKFVVSELKSRPNHEVSLRRSNTEQLKQIHRV